MLKCEICGKEFKSNLSRHLSVHNISVKEYKSKYPNSKLISDEYHRLRSDISKNIFDDEHREIQRQNCKRQWQTTNIAEIQREAMTKLWQNTEFRERKNKISSRTLSEYNAKCWSDPSYREKHSKLSKQTATLQWQDASYREHMIPIILSNMETRNNIQTFEYNNSTYKCRSKLEKTIICKLIDMNIPFEYETKRIRYLDVLQNTIRTYIPDLYLPQYNLIIEIKPKDMLEDTIVICKKNACLAEGFNFEFVCTISDLLTIIERFNDYRNHSA